MPAPFFPQSSCFNQAAALQTLLALSVIRLFKSGFSPDVNTVLADLEAEEADYTTYAQAAITAWGAPYAPTGGGAAITAPTEQFTLAATPAQPNTIGGYWIETAAGDVVLIRQFDDPVPMVVAGNAVLITPTIAIPNGV